jgi:hypothetical protein
MPNDPKPLDGRQYLTEYIAGGTQAALMAVRQALPQYIDDVTRDFGGDVYDRMLEDPAVEAAFDQFRLGVMADGIRVQPAVEMPGAWAAADPEDIERAERAAEYAAFVERCICGMEGQSLSDVAHELLIALAHGHKVAEIVLKPGTGEDAGRLVLRAVKPKKRGHIAFVVDEWTNVAGLIGVKPGQGHMLSGQGVILGDVRESQGFVPREKVILFQHAVRDGDPRGTSALRSAYKPWFLKTQVLPEFFKFLKQFGSPGIVGKTPSGPGDSGFVPRVDDQGQPIVDANGMATLITAEQALLNALLGWANAAALVVKGGTEIDFLQSEGDGAAFRDALDYFDRQITLAILGTTGLTMEAKRDSQAAKSISQDVVQAKTSLQKGRLAEAITHDLFRLLIRVNFGDEAVPLAPLAVLSQTEQQDVAKELDAMARAYAAGFIHESQLPALDARLGLPERDMESIARERAEGREMQRMAAGDLRNTFDPGMGAGAEDE